MKQRFSFKLAPLALLPALILGCATVRPSEVGPLDATGRTGTITLQPQLRQARGIQALAKDIASLSVTPYVEESSGVFKKIDAATGLGTDATERTLSLTQTAPIDFSHAITFSKLFPNKKYRFIAQAFGSQGALISSDADSTLDVTLANSKTANFGSIPVKLVDVPFAASTWVLVNLSQPVNGATIQMALYNVTNPASPLKVSEMTLTNPDVRLTNLQGETKYRVDCKAFQGNGLIGEGSASIDVGTEETLPDANVLITIIPG